MCRTTATGTPIHTRDGEGPAGGDPPTLGTLVERAWGRSQRSQPPTRLDWDHLSQTRGAILWPALSLRARRGL